MCKLGSSLSRKQYQEIDAANDFPFKRFICCLIYHLLFLISYQTVESKVDGFKHAVVETPM